MEYWPQVVAVRTERSDQGPHCSVSKLFTENSGLNWTRTLTSAMLVQLSYQANWELVVLWVNDKPVDSSNEISLI